jgi:hypothetical protein
MRADTRGMSATAIYIDRDTDVDTFDSGDEIEIWTVCKGDDDGEPMGKVYTFRNGDSRKRAFALAIKMAKDAGGLEIVQG